MSDNFYKFLFVGVMIIVTVFANRPSPSTKVATLTAAQPSLNIQQKTVPVFVLQSAPPISPPVYLSPASSSEAEVVKQSNLLVKQILGDRVSADISLPSSTEENGRLSRVQNQDLGNAILESAAAPNEGNFVRLGSDPPPYIQSRAALVADLKTGERFFSSNAGLRWPLASLTKLMTAAVVSRNIALNQSTTLQEKDFDSDSSRGDLRAGERYSIGDLRLAMLMESSNEAARALANFYGYDKFVSAMNAQAAEWGLTGTYFDEPTGISVSNQSSIDDLINFMSRIYDQYPEVFKITSKQSAYITELNSRRRVLIRNINNFAGQSDFLGGKTGYTDEAGGNLISVFAYKRQPILIIVLGTEDRFGDTRKLLDWFEGNYK
jgi:D-alanyl-D-alanine endopeptidase (penicillin-binding protein 7)